MNLHQLPKIKANTKKRVGRGIGSGKGKQSGRGAKGQKARGKVPLLFSGSGLPLYKKLPLNRGYGNKKAHIKPIVIKLSDLNKFKPQSIVTIQSLIDMKFLTANEAKKKGVKVVSYGELTTAVNLQVPASAKAKELVEKAGGQIAV